MTPVLEGILVRLAKLGFVRAAGTLYEIYENEIKTAHLHSGKGLYPKKFGYAYNPNGVDYRNYTGKLFQDFTKAIQSFSFSNASTTAKLPFLSYAVANVSFRAKDVLRKEKREKKLLRTFSGLANARRTDEMDLSDDDIIDQAIQYELKYNGVQADMKQEALEEMVRKIFNKLKEQNRESFEFMQTCYDVINESEDNKLHMDEVAKRFVKRADGRLVMRCRSDMYHHKRNARAEISEKTKAELDRILNDNGGEALPMTKIDSDSGVA